MINLIIRCLICWTHGFKIKLGNEPWIKNLPKLDEDKAMPIKKVKGGYQWGDHGKIYPTKAQAQKQAEAAYANGYKEPTKKVK